VTRRAIPVLLLALLATAGVHTQSGIRRLATIDALRQFPGFYHLQNVLVRGQFSTEGTRIVLRADEQEIHILLDDGVSMPSGDVDVRALLIDVGRLDAGDPRVGSFAQGRDAEKWPRPGEELLLRVSAVANPQTTSGATVRGIAIEPWRYDGQTVTIVGNFRGRNLFGDLPGAPGKSRYDFVLRGTEGALWVTDLRPRGQGFDLDVNRRVDSDRWIEVTGTVTREKGLVSLKATRMTLAKTPQASAPADEPEPPPVAKLPVEVVFNSPTEGETDVSTRAPIRIQFSRGLNEASLADHIRVSYVGQGAGTAIEFKATYDGANRAILITTAQPLDALRTVRIELLEGLTGFDGAPVRPWVLTFTAGG